MGDESESTEDQDSCKAQEFKVYRAEPGQVLMDKRTFYFYGNENITVENIEEMAISNKCIRMVTNKGMIHIVHHAHLLAETILPAKGQNPFLFNPSEPTGGK